MSALKRIQSFFSTHTETSEDHLDGSLRSRYYKTTVKKAMEAVQTVAKSSKDAAVTSVSEERGEISISISKPKKALLIATVISVRPFETAVDFSASTDTPLPTDFGNSQRVIRQFYQQLDATLPYVGSGLYPRA
ncbi:cytosolic protein [Metabacillus sp. GX 13764]|uniref:cytosolic protein n=1 Tax=Metabacillus kandeliae TaxID=2900151 RepID=UPI001E3AC47F|nr:cytosolic protein [Metabacillus kandeliae]MCD7032813.1 cytosolic protein [Metabacillus kandeliae]